MELCRLRRDTILVVICRSFWLTAKRCMVDLSVGITTQEAPLKSTDRVIQSTVLGDFGRSVRDEPLYLVYTHKIWVEKGEVLADEVLSWLKKRYAEARKGNRYRVVTYLHSNGFRYVDYVLMESVSDKDLIYMKMRWGWAKEKVQRGEKAPRRRMNSAQKALFDARLAQLRTEFWDMIDRERPDRVDA